MINLPLHGSVALFMRDVTSNLRVTSTSLCGVYATFLILLVFEVKGSHLVTGNPWILVDGDLTLP